MEVKTNNKISRRTFLKTVGLVGAGLGTTAAGISGIFPKKALGDALLASETKAPPTLPQSAAKRLSLVKESQTTAWPAINRNFMTDPVTNEEKKAAAQAGLLARSPASGC